MFKIELYTPKRLTVSRCDVIIEFAWLLHTLYYTDYS